MRRLTWLVLLGGVCVGCAKQESPQPNVVIEPGEPIVPAPVLVADASTGKVGALNFAKLWDPKEDEKTDPGKLVKQFLAHRHFVKHQSEYLAPATVGTMVTLTQGGVHAIAIAPALTVAYPQIAKKLETEGMDRLIVNTTPNIPILDYTTNSTGAASIRVLRVKGGTNDELRMQFGEYLTRLEEAVKGTGVHIMAHQRGGLRITGPLSDIRYETQSRARNGYARSVLVRGYDENDIELKTLMLGDVAKDDGGALVKAVMNAEKGPYLIVSLREQRQ